MDFNNIGGESIEKTGQLLFRDNGNFIFRQIDLDNAVMIEKKNNAMLKGWRHYFKLEFPFEGFKNIPEGMYSLCHERDVVWDPFDILTKDEKPDTNTSKGIFNRRGFKEIAESTCYRHENEPMPSTMMDKISWALIFLVVIFGIFIVIDWI